MLLALPARCKDPWAKGFRTWRFTGAGLGGTLVRLAFACCAVTVLGLAACSNTPPPTARAGLPDLAEVTRAGAGAAHDFEPCQSGAGYAADLPANHCTDANGEMSFTP